MNVECEQRYRHDAEGAAGLVGDASDALRMSDHFADAVARVPHETFRAQLLAVACVGNECILKWNPQQESSARHRESEGGQVTDCNDAF